MCYVRDFFQIPFIQRGVINIQIQLADFVLGIILGAGIGLAYDAFRILRKAIKTSNFFVFIEDVLFFFLAGITTFNFLLETNMGKIRFYILFAELIGMLIYFATLSKIIMGVSNQIILFVKSFLRLIKKLVLLPLLRLLVRIIYILAIPIIYIYNIINKLIKKYKFSLKRRRIMLYNLAISNKKPEK
ncbi:MAG: spore cortex biosynthesis protein YabQ [Oscillospiraceae bacterium]